MHIIVPLFPYVIIDGSPVPRTLHSLDQLDKASGGPGCSWISDQIPKDMPAEQEFHWAVITKEAMPKTHKTPTHDRWRSGFNGLGHKAPNVLDAVTAILWESQLSGKQYVSNGPRFFTRCKELIRGQGDLLIQVSHSRNGLHIGPVPLGAPSAHGGIMGWIQF